MSLVVRRSFLPRLLCWLAGGAAALVAGVIALALFPPVQRALLRRSLAAAGATGIHIESFRATPGGVAAARVAFVQGPLHLDVRGFHLALNPWSLLRRRVEVTRLAADEFNVTWSLATPAPPGRGAASASPPNPAPLSATFPGLLRMARLPLPLSLEGVDLRGQFQLARGTPAWADIHWKLHGGGLGPGQTGSFSYVIAATGPALATAGPVHLGGALTVTEGAHGEVLGLGLNGSLEAQDAALASWPANFQLRVTAGPDGETYAGRSLIGPDIQAKLTGNFSSTHQVLQVQAGFSTAASLPAHFPQFQPLLATASSLDGSLQATFRTDQPTWSATRAIAELKVDAVGALIRLSLAKPWLPTGQPGTGVLANLQIAHLPATWANPWLASTGVHIDSGEAAGSWGIEVKDGSVHFAPTAPLTLAPLQISSSRFPTPGILRLRASPRIEVAPTGAHLAFDDFLLESDRGPRIEVAADAGFTWTGVRSLELSALALAVRPHANAPAALSLTLLQPLPLDPSNPAALIAHPPAGDLLRITAGVMPLGWMSRWLPGRTVAGSLVGGESLLRGLRGTGLTLVTPTPWRVSGLRFVEGGREFFHGNLEASPSFVYGPAEQWVRLDHLALQDARGYRINGRISAGLRGSDNRMGGGISLEADLPHVPGLGLNSGAFQLSLSAAAHAFPGGKGDLGHFALVVKNAQGVTRLTLAASQPIAVQRDPGGEWVASSSAPLRLTTGALSLARLNPLLTAENIAIAGVVPATELQLQFSPRRIQIASLTPLTVAHFHLERGGDVLIDRALVRTQAALDLGINYQLLPVFQAKGTADFSLTDGVVAAEGSRVARFAGRIGISADQRSGTLHDLAGSLWIDLGTLGRMPLMARAALPAQGEATFSIKKSPDKAQTVVFEGRIDHLVGHDGAAAPALTLTGHARGDLNRRVGAFSVQALLASSPHPSDLHFGLRVDYGKLALLDFSSRLEGSYVDIDAVRQFAAAFHPGALAPDKPSAAPAPVSAPVVASAVKSGSASLALARAGVVLRPPDGPPWGGLRGHFILAIQTVAFRPYEIDQLGGRLDATADSLTLSNLSGAVLDGKWSAGMAAHFHPRDPAGEDDFDAHFHLLQLDAGRAVKMHFPNPTAGLDGRLDLDLTLASQANDWEDLVTHASGKFTLVGHGGEVRLTLPNQGAISSALIVGGTLTFSSELRALGRLVQRLAKVPISQLHASGTLGADGRLQLSEMRLDSPDLRLVATGRIPDAKSRDLMGQPLSAQATLFARGDLAVILKGMHLLGPAGADGYSPMKQPFVVAGDVGQPNFQSLYELLARAVEGSSGTWGALMRKVQAEVAKRQAGGN